MKFHPRYPKKGGGKKPPLFLGFFFFPNTEGGGRRGGKEEKKKRSGMATNLHYRKQKKKREAGLGEGGKKPSRRATWYASVITSHAFSRGKKEKEMKRALYKGIPFAMRLGEGKKKRKGNGL